MTYDEVCLLKLFLQRWLELPVLNVYVVFRNLLRITSLNTPRQAKSRVSTLQDEIRVPSTA